MIRDERSSEPSSRVAETRSDGSIRKLLMEGAMYTLGIEIEAYAKRGDRFVNVQDEIG